MALIEVSPVVERFQARVLPWLIACFGVEVASDKTERNHRFLEEALEAVQSAGCTRSEAHQLVDYVYGRPVGDLPQEVGGVMVTLAAMCLAHSLDMHDCGETELSRVWTKVEKIRAKHAAKPKHSPVAWTIFHSRGVVMRDPNRIARAFVSVLGSLDEAGLGEDADSLISVLGLTLGMIAQGTSDPQAFLFEVGKMAKGVTNNDLSDLRYPK